MRDFCSLNNVEKCDNDDYRLWVSKNYFLYYNYHYVIY